MPEAAHLVAQMRARHRLSQTALAELLGLSKSGVATIERQLTISPATERHIAAVDYLLASGLPVPDRLHPTDALPWTVAYTDADSATATVIYAPTAEAALDRAIAACQESEKWSADDHRAWVMRGDASRGDLFTPPVLARREFSTARPDGRPWVAVYSSAPAGVHNSRFLVRGDDEAAAAEAAIPLILDYRGAWCEGDHTIDIEHPEWRGEARYTVCLEADAEGKIIDRQAWRRDWDAENPPGSTEGDDDDY